MNLQAEIEVAKKNVERIVEIENTPYDSIRKKTSDLSSAIHVAWEHVQKVSDSSTEEEYLAIREIYKKSEYYHNFRM